MRAAIQDLVTAEFHIESSEVTIHDQPFRIDQLTATMAPFAQTPSASGAVPEWVVQCAIGIPLILAGLLFMRSYLRRVVVVREIEEVEAPVILTPEDREARRRKNVTESLDTASEESPEAVAGLIRTWLTEEE